MNINIKNLVSMTDANQNFSKVAKLVDENGAAVILKNNTPRYVILDYNQIDQNSNLDSNTVEDVSKKILSKHIKAFKKLAE